MIFSGVFFLCNTLLYSAVFQSTLFSDSTLLLYLYQYPMVRGPEPEPWINANVNKKIIIIIIINHRPMKMARAVC